MGSHTAQLDDAHESLDAGKQVVVKEKVMQDLLSAREVVVVLDYGQV